MNRKDPGLASRSGFLKVVDAGAAMVSLGGVACGAGFPGRLSVEPPRARSDEPFVVRVAGLPPGERVALTASFDDALGQEWFATAIFEADGNGDVDTSTRTPVGGSYATEDPMGLVWSALGPGLYAPPPGASPVRIAARVGDREARREVKRFDAADGVRTEEVREDGLVGRLFSPPGTVAMPAVLVLGGSEGGLPPYVEREAALLASRGFAALALAYFRGEYFEPDGAGGLSDTLTNIPLEYFGRAIRWLGGKEGVRGDRLGVLGTSRGGELALLLGATYPELRAVVSYVGSGAVVSSPEEDAPAWTLEGKPLPYVRFPEEGSSEIPQREIEAAVIAVERTNGPVLLIAAGDDALWPSERLSGVAYERLKRHDRPHDEELAVYPDAGHLLGAPYAPTGDGVAQYGGTAEANARANEDSWSRATRFLDGSLKR